MNNDRHLVSRSCATHRDWLGTLDRVTALIGWGLPRWSAGYRQRSERPARGSACADQAGFVGGDDELGPGRVCAQFREQPSGMVLMVDS